MTSLVPRAALSRWAGKVARAPWSRFLIPAFVRAYDVDVSEAAAPLDSYRSLQAFFTRRLKTGLRPIDSAAGVLTSPVDGTVGACGRLQRGQLLQAKGISYRVADLLGDPAAAARWDDGLFCTLYLAPPDYHRVHAPERGRVRAARYIPGAYWPVHPDAVARIPALFVLNERLVAYLDTEPFRLALVMVGACLVGGIRASFDPRWNSGPGPHAAATRTYDPPVLLSRGEELGRFEFGSTVILLVEAAAGYDLEVAPGNRVRMGEALLRRR